jgi:hypothetical protein
VKNEYLIGDGKLHQNIFIFDFWIIEAESDQNPRIGQVNCLKYEFETNHNNGDSHPNKAAKQLAGPLFAKFVVDSIKKFSNR